MMNEKNLFFFNNEDIKKKKEQNHMIKEYYMNFEQNITYTNFTRKLCSLT